LTYEEIFPEGADIRPPRGFLYPLGGLSKSRAVGGGRTDGRLNESAVFGSRGLYLIVD
jgi:hypothetical protein